MWNKASGGLAIFLTGAAGLWIAGFIAFLSEVSKPAGEVLTEADAIVVFTGDRDRIVSGMGLLNKGIGKRLLISGVNPDSRTQLSDFWSGPETRFDCCVDLGVEARSTRGNALETQNWADEHEFQRVVLVTSNYHMPRAQLEMRRRLPDVEIIPFPVASDIVPVHGPPDSLSGWKTLAIEFTKFVAASARGIFPTAK